MFRRITALWILFVAFILLQTSALYAAPKVSRSYREAAKHYRFTIGTQYRFNRYVSGSVVQPEVAEQELTRFFDALDDLDEKFIRKSGLKKVIICRDLRLNGMPCDGITAGSVILMNAGFAKQTVYHEMFHVFDNANDDKAWQKLNHKKFIYRKIDFPNRPVSKGHKRKIKKNEAKLNGMNFALDFASSYAQSNEKEDRAETFAFMVAEGKRFTERAKKSPALWGKMHYIIESTSRRSLLSEGYWRNKLGDDAMNKNRFKQP